MFDTFGVNPKHTKAPLYNEREVLTGKPFLQDGLTASDLTLNSSAFQELFLAFFERDIALKVVNQGS
ncbi:hypothetical protein GCM10028773_00330 [Spirosoma koreense]